MHAYHFIKFAGRLEDLIQKQALSLTQCRFFILDEADGLLKAGYEPLINRLHEAIPKMTSDGTRLQMIVCSGKFICFVSDFYMILRFLLRKIASSPSFVKVIKLVKNSTSKFIPFCLAFSMAVIP